MVYEKWVKVHYLNGGREDNIPPERLLYRRGGKDSFEAAGDKFDDGHQSLSKTLSNWLEQGGYIRVDSEVEENAHGRTKVMDISRIDFFEIETTNFEKM